MTVVVFGVAFASDVVVCVLVVFFVLAPLELKEVAAEWTLTLEAFVVAVGTAKSSSALSNKCLSRDDEPWMACTVVGDNGPVNVVVCVVSLVLGDTRC